MPLAGLYGRTAIFLARRHARTAHPGRNHLKRLQCRAVVEYQTVVDKTERTCRVPGCPRETREQFAGRDVMPTGVHSLMYTSLRQLWTFEPNVNQNDPEAQRLRQTKAMEFCALGVRENSFHAEADTEAQQIFADALGNAHGPICRSGWCSWEKCPRHCSPPAQPAADDCYGLRIEPMPTAPCSSTRVHTRGSGMRSSIPGARWARNSRSTWRSSVGSQFQRRELVVGPEPGSLGAVGIVANDAAWKCRVGAEAWLWRCRDFSSTLRLRSW